MSLIIFASWLVSNGVGLDTIRQLMAHKDRATTDRYATLEDAVSREALESLPTIPRERQKKTRNEGRLVLVREHFGKKMARTG